MKKLCLHPLFFLGLVIRLALIIFMAPLAVSEWYVPFLDTSISSLTLDPMEQRRSPPMTTEMVDITYGLTLDEIRELAQGREKWFELGQQRRAVRPA
jgi:hypothetical protein